MKITKEDSEKDPKKDTMRLLIVSVLLAILFGVVSAEDTISKTLNIADISESMTLLGIVTIEFSKITTIIIFLPISYIISLGFKYENNSLKLNKLSDTLYTINIWGYGSVFIFTMIFYLLVILLTLVVMYPFIVLLLLIILLLLLFMFFKFKKKYKSPSL